MSSTPRASARRKSAPAATSRMDSTKKSKVEHKTKNRENEIEEKPNKGNETNGGGNGTTTSMSGTGSGKKRGRQPKSSSTVDSLPIPTLPLTPIISSLNGLYGDIHRAMESYSATLCDQLESHLSQHFSNSMKSNEIKSLCDRIFERLRDASGKCVDHFEENSRKQVFNFDETTQIPKLNVRDTLGHDEEMLGNPGTEAEATAAAMAEWEAMLGKVTAQRAQLLSARALNRQLNAQLSHMQRDQEYVDTNVMSTVGVSFARPKNDETMKLMGKVTVEGQKVKKEHEKLLQTVEVSKWAAVVDKRLKEGKTGGKEKEKEKENKGVQPQTQLKRDQKKNPVGTDSLKAFKH